MGRLQGLIMNCMNQATSVCLTIRLIYPHRTSFNMLFAGFVQHSNSFLILICPAYKRMFKHIVDFLEDRLFSNHLELFENF